MIDQFWARKNFVKLKNDEKRSRKKTKKIKKHFNSKTKTGQRNGRGIIEGIDNI
jgi:hypothetical protein